MRTLAVALLVPASMLFAAGPISIGVKGGVPFTDAFDTATSGQLRYITNNKHWTLGPEVDLNLPFGLGVEVDALYRRLNYDSNASVANQLIHSATTANAWDFPVLAKWKMSPGPIRPYVSVGPTFRNVSSVNQVTTFFGGGTPVKTDRPAELKNRFGTGFTIGGGVQLLGHISPEVRYTRWGWDTFSDTSGLLKSNPNEVTFLVGLTF